MNTVGPSDAHFDIPDDLENNYEPVVCETCGHDMSHRSDTDPDGVTVWYECENMACPDSDEWEDEECAVCDTILIPWEGSTGLLDWRRCPNTFCPESPKFQCDNPREDR